MPIKTTCRCGRVMFAPDEYAGCTGKCKACGAVVVVPLLMVDEPAPEPESEAAPEPLVETPESRKGFRVDGFVAALVGLPTLILAAFAIYLVIEAKHAAHDARIREVKREADQLATAGSAVEAYDRYGLALDLAKSREPADEAARKDAVAAGEARDKLAPAVTKIMADRKAAEDAREAARIAEENERLKAAAARMELDNLNREYLDRQKGMAKNRATIKGGAFVKLRSNQSEILRGLEVSLLPRRVKRIELNSVLRRIQQRDVSKQAGDLFDRLFGLPSDFMIDMRAAHGACRGTSDGIASKISEIQYLAAKADLLWPESVASHRVKATKTDIDGKYRFEDIQGGDYLLCATHLSSFSFVEWCIPIEVEKSGEISIDLENDNADYIFNRIGSDD